MFDFIILVDCGCDWIKQSMACCTNDGSRCFRVCCSTIGCGNGGCCNPHSLLDHLKDKHLSEELNGDVNEDKIKGKAEDKSI